MFDRKRGVRAEADEFGSELTAFLTTLGEFVANGAEYLGLVTRGALAEGADIAGDKGSKFTTIAGKGGKLATSVGKKGGKLAKVAGKGGGFAAIAGDRGGQLAAASRKGVKRAKKKGNRALLKLALITALLWWLDRDLSGDRDQSGDRDLSSQR